MYRFSTKKNREDVIALRWPKACMSCGIDMPPNTEPAYVIIGRFYEIKKTQVLVKLPCIIYMCDTCLMETDLAMSLSPEKLGKFEETAKNLQSAPYNEFIESVKDGSVKIADDIFRMKLQKANPDAILKSKKNPMIELRRILSLHSEAL